MEQRQPPPADRETAKAALTAAIRRNIFANRYMFHPSEIEDLASRLADNFHAFSTAGDAASVREMGGSLAHEGLSIQSVMSSVDVLNGLHSSPADVSTYASELVGGFVSGRESEIVSSQEQLRRALSSTLEQQGRDLLVKNQAIDSSINGIMIIDLDGKITYVNRSFLSMWGYENPVDVVGNAVEEFWAYDEARAVVERFRQSGAWSGELPAIRKDGSSFTISLSASYIRNAAGDEIGIMAFFVDVTESKSLELQMQQLQKMDDLGQLAGGIVHDFNNLLAAIGGYLQLVLLEAPPEGQMHRDLMQIKSAVDRGAGLTKQLGYFTRQATGKREVISLNDVAVETYELLKHTFPRNIDVRLELNPTLWKIEADPNQMSQVIMNLCVNARDAIIEKSVNSDSSTMESVTIETANVELTERAAQQYVDVKPGRYVALRIIDTGVGIAPHVRKRLFVPFVTTKTEASGTGLGLAVVYGIVRSHHGFIDLTSTQGFGTTFFVYIPMAESEPVRDRELRSEARLVRGEGTILVVDDETQVREVISRALGLCGYRVLEASSGLGALECYRERANEIDLVLLDVVMPEMNGQETLDRLRAMNASVPALFMTGYTSDGRLAKLAERGLASVVEKPIDFRKLTERIRELVGGGR